jgi:hypothetical protein
MGLKDLFKNKKKGPLPSQRKAASLKMNSGTDIEKSGNQIKSLQYPVKILVAWGESITGNKEIRDWLMKNGYQELGMFCFALRNELSAQTWLLKNGYPHLLALIKGIEGDMEARDWLKSSGQELLWTMAVAAHGDHTAKQLLLKRDKIYAALAMKMERLKDDIEWDNNSIHQINP